MRPSALRGILALSGGVFAALTHLESPHDRDQIYIGDHEEPGPGTELHKNHTSPKPLQCFQVAQPILGPHGPVQQQDDGAAFHGSPCSIELMQHSFGFSYGKPFVGKFR